MSRQGSLLLSCSPASPSDRAGQGGGGCRSHGMQSCIQGDALPSVISAPAARLAWIASPSVQSTIDMHNHVMSCLTSKRAARKKGLEIHQSFPPLDSVPGSSRQAPLSKGESGPGNGRTSSDGPNDLIVVVGILLTNCWYLEQAIQRQGSLLCRRPCTVKEQGSGVFLLFFTLFSLVQKFELSTSNLSPHFHHHVECHRGRQRIGTWKIVAPKAL